MKPGDEELVRRALSGDVDSFGELVRRYRGAVQGLAYHMTGSFEDAEDIAQEVFITAYLKLSQLRDPDRFASWLRRITVNCCKMWMRGRRESVPLEEVDEELLGTVPSPAEEIEREEMRRLLAEALSQLPEGNRLVITLYYLTGLSYRDIARFLDVPLSTVEGRMHRAKRQLKGRLMRLIEEGLRKERLSDEFIRRVLDEAMKRAREARGRWAGEEFIRSCREAMEAAGKLGDVGAQVELLLMLGEARSTWLGEPEKGVEDYESALKLARKRGDKGREAEVLKALFIAHCRRGEYSEMRRRAEEALKLFSELGDRENEALTRAALDLADMLPGMWRPGQPGGYVMAVFPVQLADEGYVFLDPKSVRNYSWGCPSRCAALVHLLRPRRFLKPSPKVGETWEDRITRRPDGLSWGIEEGDELIARSVVESDDDLVLTPAGRFERCLRVRTVITPPNVGVATEFRTRSYCGTRLTWFAPGVGLVKLRHEDQNGMTWVVHLVEHAGSGGEGYFPLSIGRMWRYRWTKDHSPEEMFEDVCRVVSCCGNTFYISSATVGVKGRGGALSYLEGIAELERESGDLAGEAAILRWIAWISKERGIDCYERLIEIYKALGDEPRLIDARWLLKEAREGLSDEDKVRWREEKLRLARKIGDRRKIMEALGALAKEHLLRGEYERAAELYRKAADIAAEGGDAYLSASYTSLSETAREMIGSPPSRRCFYIRGVGCLIEREGGLYSKGSDRSSIGERPSGSEGTPMTDLFWYEPFSGAELLSQEVGSSLYDGWNIGIAVNGSVTGDHMKVGSVLVSKDERVEVPAGEFEGCALIETTISASGEEKELVPEIERIRGYYAGVKRAWFAPGVGLVRLLYQHKNGRVTDIQLVEHQVKEPGEDYLPMALGNRWRYRWKDEESGRVFEDLLVVASQKGNRWYIAFVTRATAAVDR